MAICNGRGGQGDHCCFIAGEVCSLLVYVDNQPRCSVWGQWDSEPYLSSPAATMFAERWPGKNCADWPQNIPEVMEVGIGLCCWQGSE